MSATTHFPVLTPQEAAELIDHGAKVGIGGFTGAGTIKATGRALAARATAEHEAGRPFQIRILSGSSTGHSVDGALAAANAISFRFPYQSDSTLRKAINSGEVAFYDLHLSHVPQYLEYGFLGDVDIALIEATCVTPEGHVYLTAGSGATPSFLKMAKKIIIEVNAYHSPRLREMHDVFMPALPPHRREIPVYHPLDKIGMPYAWVDPAKIAGIVYTNEPDECGAMAPCQAVHEAIGANVVDFLVAELKNGHIPSAFLPLQSGVGNVANAVLASLGNQTRIPNFTMFTEVFQDACLDLMDAGRLVGASTCSLTLCRDYLQRMYANFDRYAEKIVIRPQSMSNNPELIRRLGIISMNTALEFDIYGNVNSTHVCGTDLMNGIGGSGDFTRNAYISIFMAPSTAKGGKISTIVPMVSHSDQNEHSVQIMVTEHGLADLRGAMPGERAERIIENCAHPDYRPLLREYLHASRRGHLPNDLRHAFDFHVRFQETGSMQQ